MSKWQPNDDFLVADHSRSTRHQPQDIPFY